MIRFSEEFLWKLVILCDTKVNSAEADAVVLITPQHLHLQGWPDFILELYFFEDLQQVTLVVTGRGDHGDAFPGHWGAEAQIIDNLQCE